MDATSYIAVESSCGRFQLVDLIDSEGVPLKSPSLRVRQHIRHGGAEIAYWDNTNYLIALFKNLDNDYHSSFYMEFVSLCSTYLWDPEETIKVLLNTFEVASQIGMFDKKQLQITAR